MKATVKLFNTDIPSSPGSNLIIPKDVAEKAIEEFREKLKNDESFGTFCWDTDCSLMKASHKILDLSMDSNGVVWMELEILGTPRGVLLQETINQNINRFMPEIIGTMEEIKFHKVAEFHFTRNLYPPKSE